MPLLFSSNFNAALMVKQCLFNFYLPVLLCINSECAYSQEEKDPRF